MTPPEVLHPSTIFAGSDVESTLFYISITISDTESVDRSIISDIELQPTQVSSHIYGEYDSTRRNS